MNVLLLITVSASAATEPLVSWTLDDSDGGFAAYGETSQWQWGELPGGPATAEHTTAWGTGIERPYLNDTTDYLQLSSFDLSTSARPVLRFYHWYEVDADGDAGWVEVWDASVWSRLEPIYDYPTDAGYTGSSNGWHLAWFDLRGVTDTAHIRFVFSADSRVALAGWFVDDIDVLDGDPVPPSIEVDVAPDDTQDLDGPYAVEAWIQDDLLTPSAELRWTTGTDSGSVAMEETLPGLFRGEIPGQLPDTTVSWRIVATDGSNEALAPEVGASSFRVYLAAPTALTGPQGRVVGTQTSLSWTAPESDHPVQSYRVYCNGEIVALSEDTTAQAAICSSAASFEVSAVYEAGEGDRSDPLSLDAFLPSVDALSPAVAWQGDHLRLTLSGTYLLLAEGEVSLDLGDGVTVDAVEVIDAESAIITVHIDADAETGLREGQLQVGDASLPLPSPFEILDGQSRPRLLSVTPDAVVQGERYTLEIAANADFEATPTLDLGEGVLIESVERDGEIVRAEVVVAWDAPVGERGIEADDGDRVLDGATLRVRNAATPPARTCSQGSGQAHWTLAALSLAVAALRARGGAARSLRSR